MTSTKTIIGVIAGVVFVGGIIYFATQTPKTVVPNATQTTATDQSSTTTSSSAKSTDTKGSATTTTGPTSYTLAQVATHSGSASCWTTITGNVYDLTTWIGQHPGGEGAILSICGKDGTTAFMGQHGDNSRANATLATFKIGILK